MVTHAAGALDPTLAAKYGRGAPELFAPLGELSDIGGHAGVTRYLHHLYLRHQHLQEAYPDLAGDDAHRLVDWAYRHGRNDVPIPPELLAGDWLNGPADVGAAAGVTRYMHLLYCRHPGLQAAYPDLEGADGPAFVRWATTVGRGEDPVLAALLSAPTPEDARGAWPRELPRRLGSGLNAGGVNVVGYLRSELGLGEAARLTVAALDAASVPLLPVVREVANHRAEHRFTSVPLDVARFGINLMCMNPDQHWTLARELDRPMAAERYTIGFWWWEPEGALPLEWRPGFHLVDEVWVGSEHTAAVIGAISPVPVLSMPLPVLPGPAPRPPRASLGLPAEGFVFLTALDYHSTWQRKNPIGVIEAFRRAFPPHSGASLVLKSVNGAHHSAARERVRAAAGAHPDILFIDGHVTAAEKNALIAACDCYVSLHRAEGFGIPMAEAMYYGRPVIATGYSGNLEFMNAETSHLVDHTMTLVGSDAEPYYPADARWAEPDVGHAARLMRAVFDDPAAAAALGRAGAEHVRARFSAAVAGGRMRDRLDHIRRELLAPGDRGAMSPAADATAARETLARADLLAQLRVRDAQLEEIAAELATLAGERSRPS
jgi:glycosyltransferase involved in cell wall biosynthesis